MIEGACRGPIPFFWKRHTCCISLSGGRETRTVRRSFCKQYSATRTAIMLPQFCPACNRLRLCAGSGMLSPMVGVRSCFRRMRVRKWLRGAVRAGEMLLLCAVLLWLGGVRDAGHDLGGTTGGLGALSAGTCPGEGASLSGCVQRPTLYAVLPDGREWTPPAMHACPRWIDGRDRWARLLLLSSLRTMRADLRRGGRHASGHCDRQAVARSTQLLC